MKVDNFDEHYKDLLVRLTSAFRRTRDTSRSVSANPSFENDVPYSLRLRWPYSPILLNPVRKINHRYAVAEWLWITLGMKELAPLLHFNKRIGEWSDDGETLAGAYGPMLQSFLPEAVAKLRKDPDSRQGVVQIWRPDLATTKTKDTPCTLFFHFIAEPMDRNPDLRTEKRLLDMVGYMRSNDAWLGLPYDVFTFTMIHRQIAKELDMEVGDYLHFATSEHLYERDFQKAWDAVMNTPQGPALGQALPVPPMPVLFEDPRELADLRTLFSSLHDHTAEGIANAAGIMGLEEFLPYLLFLRSKWEPGLRTGNWALDEILTRMEATHAQA